MRRETVNLHKAKRGGGKTVLNKKWILKTQKETLSKKK